jgi:hypothetical protein
MGGHRCRNCDTVVKVGRFCSRCGSPQPRHLVRPFLTIAGLTLIGTLLVSSFLRLEGGGMPTKPPSPSNGDWAGENEFSSEDVRPNEPTIFMATSKLTE